MAQPKMRGGGLSESHEAMLCRGCEERFYKQYGERCQGNRFCECYKCSWSKMMPKGPIERTERVGD